MKITAVETLVCHARMRNWVFVKVVTDQPGLIGWGEATLEWHTRAVVGAVQDIAELLIGEDPRRIEHLWQMMFRQHFWHGNGIVRSTAISGIDIALWDIAGKVANMPCSQLWGGPVRDWVRTYCHLGGGKMEDFYETSVEDAKQFGDLAQKAVEDGYTAFKSMAVPPTMPIEGLRPVRLAEAAVASMRGRGRRRHRHYGRLPRSTVSSDGTAIRKSTRSIRSVLLRRALLAGICRRSGGDQRCHHNSRRNRRTSHRPVGIPETVRAACVRNLPARHHALRRPDRGSQNCSVGRCASNRSGTTQSARPGQHGRVAGIRFFAAGIHHLRDRSQTMFPGETTSSTRASRSNLKADW